MIIGIYFHKGLKFHMCLNSNTHVTHTRTCDVVGAAYYCLLRGVTHSIQFNSIRSPPELAEGKRTRTGMHVWHGRCAG